MDLEFVCEQLPNRSKRLTRQVCQTFDLSPCRLSMAECKIALQCLHVTVKVHVRAVTA